MLSWYYATLSVWLGVVQSSRNSVGFIDCNHIWLYHKHLREASQKERKKNYDTPAPISITVPHGRIMSCVPQAIFTLVMTVAIRLDFRFLPQPSSRKCWRRSPSLRMIGEKERGAHRHFFKIRWTSGLPSVMGWFPQTRLYTPKITLSLMKSDLIYPYHPLWLPMPCTGTIRGSDGRVSE